MIVILVIWKANVLLYRVTKLRIAQNIAPEELIYFYMKENIRSHWECIILFQVSKNDFIFIIIAYENWWYSSWRTKKKLISSIPEGSENYDFPK
jgi:hypothetical protein